MARKPRADSKLKTLPEDRQIQAYEWVRDLGYEKALVLLEKELQVSTSIGALHDFWHWKNKSVQENRILRAITASDEILQTAGENLGKLEQATAAALQQATFEAVMSGDPDHIKILGNLLIKTRKAALDEAQLEQRVREYEEKAAQAKTEIAKAVQGGGLSPEAIARIEEAAKIL